MIIKITPKKIHFFIFFSGFSIYICNVLISFCHIAIQPTGYDELLFTKCYPFNYFLLKKNRHLRLY